MIDVSLWIRLILDMIGLIIALMLLDNLQDNSLYMFALARGIAFFLRVMLVFGSIDTTCLLYQTLLTIQTLTGVLGLWLLFLVLKKQLGWNNTLIDKLRKWVTGKTHE